MNLQPDNEFAAFIGIDWADAKHDICLQAADSGKRALAILAHCPKAIDAVGLRPQTTLLWQTGGGVS